MSTTRNFNAFFYYMFYDVHAVVMEHFTTDQRVLSVNKALPPEYDENYVETVKTLDGILGQNDATQQVDGSETCQKN